MTRDSEDIGVAELAAAHRRQGYSQIGAHFVVRRNGDIEIGRPTNLPGSLSRDMNHRAIQVCLIGGLNDHLEPHGYFTSAQVDALGDIQARFDFPLHYGPEQPLKNLK